MKNKPLRVILFFVVFALILVMPWWLSSLMLISLTIYMPFYLEVLFFGYWYDSLYSANLHFPYTALVSAAVFLAVVVFVKSRIRT